MEKEKVLRIISIVCNAIALVIFAVCIFGEHNSKLVAIGLMLVAVGNFFSISFYKGKNENKDEKKESEE